MLNRIAYKVLFVIAVCAVLSFLLVSNRVKRGEIAMLRNNVSVLTDSVNSYRVLDSLNAVQAKALRLKAAEWREAYEDEAAIVKKLKSDKRNLQATISVQLQTIEDFKSILRPVVVHDTTGLHSDTIRCFDYSDEWISVSGCINKDTATIHAACRDELLAVESVQRKRILGIPLSVRLFGYKSHTIDVVSMNPNCEITKLTYKTIEK